jgi:Zn-finger nucleic acid-binding protein
MTTVIQACPDCGGPNVLTRGELDDDGKILRKAGIQVTHLSTCAQWIQKARHHGCHPDIHVLIHEDEGVRITEGAR